MKNKTGRYWAGKRSVIVGALLLTAYGLLLFSLGPEWVMWAGSMAMGVLYLPDLTPPIVEGTCLAVRMAFLSGLLTLFALAILTGVIGEGWRD